MLMNVRLTPPELIAILNNSEARLLLYENDFAPLGKALHPSCPKIENFISLDDPYEELLSRGRVERADIAAYDETSVAELFYTSGSTGTPRGVMLSCRELYLHAMSVAGTFNRDDAGVELHTIPLFHANGWGRPQASTMMGVKQVMVRRFDPGTVFRLAQEEKATAMSLVPTMANALLNTPCIGEFDLSSLQTIHIGGGPASPEPGAGGGKGVRCACAVGERVTGTCPVARNARHKSTV